METCFLGMGYLGLIGVSKETPCDLWVFYGLCKGHEDSHMPSVGFLCRFPLPSLFFDSPGCFKIIPGVKCLPP